MECPGEQLLIRLWETLSEKGIGSLLKPWQIKREGMARLEIRRAEMLALAQTEKDIEEIRTGQKRVQDFSSDSSFAMSSFVLRQGTKRIEPKIDFPTVLEVASLETMADSVRRQLNVAHAIVHAEETLINDPANPSDKKVDDDWLYRWRDYAGDVSVKSMQFFWGRILAGELKAPGSFSLRVLEFLRNLSKEEAEAIERISCFIIHDFIWRDYFRNEAETGVTLKLLFFLQDLGVISGVESHGLQRTLKSIDDTKFIRLLKSNGKALIVEHDDPNKVLIMSAYVLTTIGQQLIQLENFQNHPEYLLKVGRAIKTQGFSVRLGDIAKISNNTTYVENEQSIED